MQFSKRLDRFGEEIFAALNNRRMELEQQGMKIYNMSVGTPDFKTPEHIKKALAEAAMDDNNWKYSLRDLPELLEAVCAYYKKRFDVELTPDMVMTVYGSQEGMGHLGMALCDEGDVVLLPDPCYPVFAAGSLMAGAKPYYYPLVAEHDFLPYVKDIPEEVARKAKLMVVSYPNNPTTAMAPAQFYRDLVAFAKKYDIIVLHDNAYSELVFDGKTCGSFLSYPGAKEIGVEFNSLSKTYGLAGARIGFCLGNKEVVKHLKMLKSNMDYGMFLPIQAAAVAALTGDQDCVYDTMKAYEARRDILCDGFRSIGWEMDRPVATMFVWAPIPKQYKSSEAFVMDLVENTGFIVTPGSAFGPSGEGFVRMALVQDREALERAIHAVDESGIFSKENS